MIENFDTDDFERTLKEHADRFTLTPSERVWRSIYNDLHPGSNWPSLATGIFMLLILLWVGHQNGSEQTPRKQPATQISAVKSNSPSQNARGETSSSTSLARAAAPVAHTPQPDVDREATPSAVHLQPAARVQTTIPETQAPQSQVADKKPGSLRMTETPDVSLSMKSGGKVVTVTPRGSVAADPLALRERNEQVTRAAIADKFARRKKLKWEFVMMPMISNVQFGGSNLNKSGASVVYTPISKHNMDVAKRLGFITGANAYYPLTDKLSLMGGVNIVYTGYDIYSEVKYPDVASLTFKDSRGKLFSKSYISYYANEKSGYNPHSITNYNWQLAVPVGVQWDVFAGNNVTFSVISTVEPFMVVGSKAYLLSGDASSYVTDPDLVRRFNVSGNVSGVVSFGGEHTRWKIGPNFRYQGLSTYRDIYPVKEHFINYGIRVGVMKK